MDVMSMVAARMQDEAMRYLYSLSLYGSPRGLAAALALVVAGVALTRVVAGVRRRRWLRALAA